LAEYDGTCTKHGLV